MKIKIIDIVLTLLLIGTCFTIHSQVKDPRDDGRTIKIPVVFHVIYSDKVVKLDLRDIGLGTHVLTHETGHWLGLYHIWGKTGSCNRFKALFKRDDGIDDTPPQKKCSDLSRTSCPPKNRAVKKGGKSNHNNFMDYSACRCMFTEKQAIKMRNNIITKRPNIY